MKDQQEAEQKKVTSQEIAHALAIQTKEITEKRKDVMTDLDKVEPAVNDAKQGMGDGITRYISQWKIVKSRFFGSAMEHI